MGPSKDNSSWMDRSSFKILTMNEPWQEKRIVVNICAMCLAVATSSSFLWNFVIFWFSFWWVLGSLMRLGGMAAHPRGRKLSGMYLIFCGSDMALGMKEMVEALRIIIRTWFALSQS